MILVTLGTQDKSFDRLLNAIDKEIDNGNIKDKVIVQAGFTFKTYKSKNMEMFDYVDTKTMNDLVKKSDVIISHAGAGSILTALENDKKIIVVPRQSKYGEHNNDHQIEIAEKFSNDGHVIYLKNLNNLVETLNNIDSFNPTKLNHNNELLKNIEEFIDNTKKKKKFLPFVMVILWACAIFFLSNMSGIESNIKSTTSLDIIIKEVLTFTNKIGLTDKHPTEARISEFAEDINPIMRKCAHATVFFILAILISIFLTRYNIRLSFAFILTVLLSFMYALFDEYHQTFVIGRTGQLTDSLIDVSGAIIGCFIVLIIVKIKRRKKKVKDKKKVIFVSSLGGHLTQMLQLKSIFNDYNYLLITEKSSVTENLKSDYNVKYYIYCNKKIFIKYFIINVINAFHSLYTFFKERPDVIVTTGANTAVPLCYLGRIFGKKVIFIESFAKRNGKTLAGTLCYPVATTFIVQWESMLKYYPKAKYFGGIY
ncbi:MAG: VanZ family protein [Erysipelotrichales bacterium]|nr:VanZ family protein [Erysipelotrichales bacterium]